MLSSMFSGKHKLERDQDGCPFIDRPGEPFEHILNFLRDKSTMPPKNLDMQVLKIFKRIVNSNKIFLCLIYCRNLTDFHLLSEQILSNR